MVRMSKMGSATFLEEEERESDKTILWRVNCWGISKLTKDFISLILRSLMKAWFMKRKPYLSPLK